MHNARIRLPQLRLFHQLTGEALEFAQMKIYFGGCGCVICDNESDFFMVLLVFGFYHERTKGCGSLDRTGPTDHPKQHNPVAYLRHSRQQHTCTAGKASLL